MSGPYYADGVVELWHGDAREQAFVFEGLDA